ncbi:hypothetical protein OF897_18315 [Chryseobacterium formosus]|uniref:Uncharacterized protein n=1 Tax=Chryseobacterium formosus TaxID=1537363 RepID=A0ABT3XW16_9FLAO|nr:hypothetical protein [Chryseobacterium formosus]MCX8525872.1 hypothetical protein [Chryseobacterium formosus]
MLLAAIGVAGLVSANTTLPKNETDKKEIVSKNEELKVEKEETITLETERRLQEDNCRTVVVTCTSAYTCQNWSEAQWQNWGSQIQTNYCMYDSPFTP